MNKAFSNHKCGGCPKKISCLRRLCPDCQELSEQAQRAFPLPTVAPHPVNPTYMEMWDRVTPEFEQQLIDADGPYNEQMTARCNAAEALRQKALLMLVAAYGVGNPLVAKLRGMKISHRPENGGARQVEVWRSKRREAAQKKQTTERELAEARKAERARMFLRKHGREVEDVSDEVALDRANELAGDLNINELRPAEGEFVKFEGRCGCSDGCRGWDGHSNVCECGGHRVCWFTDGDFENGYAYAGIC